MLPFLGAVGLLVLLGLLVLGERVFERSPRKPSIRSGRKRLPPGPS